VADWDEDSPRLRENLVQVLRAIRDCSRRREIPTLESARQWQRDTMAGLEVPHPECGGRFRGEPGLKRTRVWIGGIEGARPADVPGQLAQFEQRLQRAVSALDRRLPSDRELDADGVAAVIDLAAWAHSEWIRIHPFANGNGRTARLWANSLLLRYGLPPVVRLRPRPDGGYGAAGARAMVGDWMPTAAVLRKMLLALHP
jgi:hypothetical protein